MDYRPDKARREPSLGSGAERGKQGILTPQAREIANNASATLAETAKRLGGRAKQALDDAKKRPAKQDLAARSQAPATAFPTPAPPESTTDDPKKPKVQVEPSGLRVEMHPMEWPPRNREEERIELRRYLTKFYEKRRAPIEKKRRELEEKLESAKAEAGSKRWVSFLLAGIVFLIGLAILVVGNDAFGFIFLLGSIVAVLAGVTVGQVNVEILRDEKHPLQTDLEALHGRILNDDIKVLWDCGVRMIALDKAGPQENSLGPYLNFPNLDECGKVFVAARLGSDGKPQFTPRSLYYLSFHANQVITYEGATDLIKGVPIYHKLREFSYQDIVAVSRTRRTVSFERIDDDSDSAGGELVFTVGESSGKVTPGSAGKTNVTTQELVQLNLSNGESVSIVLDDAYLAGATEESTLPQSESDRVVELIRALVRDKKRYALEGRAAPGAAMPFAAAFTRN